ncbi:MAG: trypsin-like peptidase domain-containing protein [Planctomycetes bacterium]|nr:trypsin-like peptidase domain-containing protein [Planctomycetota bacterium]
MRNAAGRLGIRILAVTMACVPAGPACTSESDRDVYRLVANAVVGLTCKTDKGSFMGTGAFIHADGYILTTTGVLPEGAREVQVFHPDLGRLEARLVGADPGMELSLAKVPVRAEGPGYPSLPLADSDGVRVGETAYTIGNTQNSILLYGRPALSPGIVSAWLDLDAGQNALATFRGRMIETTAALNPGVDGGPLLDGAGNVIGLLSFNYAPMRRLGTAVPTNAVRETIRGWIAKDGGNAGTMPAARPSGDAPSFAEALAAAGPSILALEVTRTASDAPTPRPARQDPHAPLIERPEGVVTGLAVSRTEILTTEWNVHGNVESIAVLLPGGRRIAAEIVGWNQPQDIALLRVAEPLLRPATFADGTPRVGTRVALPGRSPHPDRLTVTTGIVSATRRRTRDQHMQIDAPVNYGNAGGPVLDGQGKVLGLVNQVRARSRQSQNSGVGFCLRADVAVEALEWLRGGAKVGAARRPFLGVTMAEPQPSPGEGAAVGDVIPQGGAEKVGLARGDVILEVDGEKIGAWQDLVEIVQRKEIGENIHVVWLRGGERMEGQATLTERPDE